VSAVLARSTSGSFVYAAKRRTPGIPGSAAGRIDRYIDEVIYL